MATVMEVKAGKYFLLVLIAAARCDRCLDDGTTVRNTTLFNQHTYKTLRQLSLFECAAECHGSRVCTSIYFEPDTETCSFNTNGSDHVGNVSRPGDLYYELKYFPKSISGACFNSTCALGSRCEVNRIGRTSCVIDVKDCGEPPEVRDANRLTNHPLQGGLTTYTCKPDFVACAAGPRTSLCRPSGIWEDAGNFCQRFRWMKAGIMKFPFPCGTSKWINVTVQATPTTTSSFVIQVKGGRGKSILFNLGFRFHALGSTNKLIINTHFHKWGEALTLPIPLTVGRESEINILLHQGVYQLQVDKKDICTFPERKIGAEPGLLEMMGKGDVRVVEIRRLN